MKKTADEGTAVAEVCRKAGISDATFYNWRKKFGGMLPSVVRQLRQLEDENSRLKKIIADFTAKSPRCTLPSEGIKTRKF